VRRLFAALLVASAGFAAGYFAALPMVARRVRLAGGHWLTVTRCRACPEAA